jgi:hypothetical protein
MSKEKVGVITLGEIAYLSDPCYDCKPNNFYNCTIETIPGDYLVYITRSESKDRWLENRITSIMAIHKDYYPKFKKMPNNDREMLWCAVDSGTCGIFDKEYYEKHHSNTSNDIDEDWYDNFVCNRMDEYITTDGKGAISSSGLGDGRYPVFAEYSGNKAFAIRIKFL